MIRRIVLSTLFAVSLASVVRAQEMTGKTAEEIKKQIIKLEEEKVSIIVKGGDVAANWFDALDADNLAYLSGAKGVRSKTDILAEWRSGVRTLLNTKHYDFVVHVYNEGETAVVTYRASGTESIKDKGSHDYQEVGLEVLVKQGGKWRAVAHSVVDVRPKLDPEGTK
jgi:ketosteroid isomerase-like protein